MARKYLEWKHLYRNVECQLTQNRRKRNNATEDCQFRDLQQSNQQAALFTVEYKYKYMAADNQAKI